MKKRYGSQEYFIDLCRLLGEPTPAEADPTGHRYCFERGARKDTGGDGWADVWKRHHGRIFPPPPTPPIREPMAIAKAARRLVELGDRSLHPPEWVEWVEEPAPGLSRAPHSPQHGGGERT